MKAGMGVNFRLRLADGERPEDLANDIQAELIAVLREEARKGA